MAEQQREIDIRFRNDVAKISTVESVTHLHHTLEVNLAIQLNGAGVDLQDLQATDFVGQGNLDLAVETTCSQQSRVKRIRPIRGHDDLRLSKVIKTIQLVEKLHQCTLDFPISRSTL